MKYVLKAFHSTMVHTTNEKTKEAEQPLDFQYFVKVKPAIYQRIILWTRSSMPTLGGDKANQYVGMSAYCA